MSTLIFFDTNFLFSNRPQKDFFDMLRSKEIMPFVSEIVIEELKGQVIRQIKKSHDDIMAKVNEKMSQLYFNLSININLEKCYKDSDKRMDRYMKDLFGTNIIPKSSDEEIVKNLFERNKIKKVPFVDGNSDKGWVDTLIWLSFIQCCKDNIFDKYIFVSNDGGFTKHINTLKNEFEENIKQGDFQIKSFSNNDEILKYFSLEQVIEEKEEQKPPFIKEEIIVEPLSQEYIEKVRDHVYSIMYTVETIGYNSWPEKNWELDRKIDFKEAEMFCNILKSHQSEFIFFSEIDFGFVFEELNVGYKTIYKVNSKDYNEFINIWNEIELSKQNYKNAFLVYIMNLLNEMCEIVQNPFDLI